MKKRRIMVSSCLLGNNVRYDGKGGRLHSQITDALHEGIELVAFCPECSAGLPTPRSPAEIKGGSGELVLSGDVVVQNKIGEDVTKSFIDGANNALQFYQKEHLDCAILKERSPSCGTSKIYDGTFSGKLIMGVGVTTALLREYGICVLSDEDVDGILKLLADEYM